MNIHLLIPMVRKAHPLKWEQLTKEQKERLVAIAMATEKIETAWREIRREIKNTDHAS